ncbi:MAG: putative Serine/threonine-protein kinase WNK3, partial [Streblomastix strix]
MTDPSERQGETDPSYRFIKDQTKLLGRGSFKEVYKAFDNERGIEVAWNQIASSKLSVKERQQLASEIDTLKTIHHRNIIKFYDYWVDKKKKQIVFISEFVSSGTIKAYIERTGVPRQPVLRNWCRQILSALAYLHGLNPKIIHRDLKCDNIFINGYNGLVKVGDLGLATKQIESKSKSLIGTPEFMAPELYEENYNEKVDIYAFGMCILEMITNQYPYNECRTAAQIFRAVTSGTPPKALSKVTDDNTRCFIEL